MVKGVEHGISLTTWELYRWSLKISLKIQPQ